MAKLYLLRQGAGDARVASSFDVAAEEVRRLYGSVRTEFSDHLPTINANFGPANPVSNPELPVIQLLEGEPSFGDFRSPGFNLLLDIEPTDAYTRLVEKKGT